MQPPAQHTVTVLGPGCRRCDTLYERAVATLRELGRTDVAVGRETDLDRITSYGPILTPALVIDGVIVLSGSVPSPRTLRKLLTDRLTSPPPVAGAG